MEHNRQQSQSINLSTFFQEITRPIKPPPLFSDPEIFFNDAAYTNCLTQLGKFLSLIESTTDIDTNLIWDENSMLSWYVNSLNKSIKSLRHSLWFLHLVPGVENEEKISVFQNGIDVFDNTIGIIDETIKMFFSFEVTSFIQIKLRDNILCLYDRCSNEVKNVKAPSLEKVPGNVSNLFESSSIAQKTVLNELENANTRNQRFSCRKTLTVTTNSTLIPISCPEGVKFSDVAHEKRFNRICKNIEDEINYFAIVKSKKLKFVCLLCSQTVRASHVEKHVNEAGHLSQKIKAQNFGAIPSSLSSINSDAQQNIENFSQCSTKVPDESGNNLKTFEPSNSSQKVNLDKLNSANSQSINWSFFRKNMDDDSSFESPHTKNFIFSKSSHEKLSNELYKNFEGKGDYLTLVESTGRQLVCLVCDMAVAALEIKCGDCDAMQKNTFTSEFRTSIPKSKSFSNSSGNLQLTEKASEVEETLESISKFNKPADSFSKTESNAFNGLNTNQLSFKNPDVKSNNPFIPESCANVHEIAPQANRSENFLLNENALKNKMCSGSSPSFSFNPKLKPILYGKNELPKKVQKQFDDLCETVGDEIDNFSVNRSKKYLKLTCLLCIQIMPGGEVAKHVKQQDHLLKTAEKNDPRLIPEYFQNKILKLSEENQKFLVYFPAAQEFVCMLCRLVLTCKEDKWFKHFQSKYHTVRLLTAGKETLFLSSSQCNLSTNLPNERGNSNCAMNFSTMDFGKAGHHSDLKAENSKADKLLNSISRPTFAEKKANNYASSKTEITPELPMSAPIALKDALEYEFLQSSEKMSKNELESLILKLDFQADFFLIYCFPGAKKVKLICRLCGPAVKLGAASNVAAHVKSKRHSLNMILPLIAERDKMYLDWCDVTRNYVCLLCKVTLPRGKCLFHHFESKLHLSNLQEPEFNSNKKNSDNDQTPKYSEAFVFGEDPTTDSLPTPVQSTDLVKIPAKQTNQSAELDALSYFKATVKCYRMKHVMFFLKLAWSIEGQVNFFSFEAKLKEDLKRAEKDLYAVCKLCNVSFPYVKTAIDHVKEEDHLINVEKNKREATIVLWIPSPWADNWKYIWPFPEQKDKSKEESRQNYFCLVCNVVVPKNIPMWIRHFFSDSHTQKLKELHQDLFTIESGFVSVEEKNLKILFRNWNKLINDHINYFSISVQKESKEFVLMCKICNDTLFFSKMEEHVNEEKHLLNLAANCVNKPSADVSDISLDYHPDASKGIKNDEDFQDKISEVEVTSNLACKLNVSAIYNNSGNGKSAIAIQNPVDNYDKGLSSSDNDRLESNDDSKISSKRTEDVKIFTDEEFEKFMNKCDEFISKLKTLEIKNTEERKESVDLSSVFKFFKVEDYFPSFFDLSDSNKCVLKENCGFLLIDEKSREVYCTACHSYINLINDEVRNLQKLTWHFKGCKHESNLNLYGPAAFFQYNVSFFKFSSKSAFCTLCSVTISCCLPADVDLLLDHFDSQKHADLVSKMFKKESIDVKSLCITLVLKELNQNGLPTETSVVLNEETDKDRIFGSFAPENLFQDSFNLDTLHFLSTAHNLQFKNLAEKINYQINYFSVNDRQGSKELLLTCEVCKKIMFASRAEEHVDEQKHLLNLATKCASKPGADVSEISLECGKFLDFDSSAQTYVCTLCDVELTSSKDSWTKHFHGEMHQSKVNESEIVQASSTEEESASESFSSSDTCSNHDSICEVTVSKPNIINGPNSCVNNKSENLLKKSEENKSITNELSSTRSRSESTNQMEKFIINCEEIVFQSGTTSKIKKTEDSFNLSSFFKFVKIEDCFTSFFGLSGNQKRLLKENSGFLLIDEKSQQMYCTACHCYILPVNNEAKNLEKLMGHFKGWQHKTSLKSYGPVALFQYNVSMFKFFNSDSVFCSLCSITISCRLPADVDLLIDHFESQKHARLVWKLYGKESAFVKSERVTLVLSKHKYLKK